MKTLADRFWPKVEVRSADECWPWRASLKPAGYGQLHLAGKTVYAHRVAWELTNGPIPDGLELDHVKARGCTRRDCCNPAHMEPVPHRENMVRGNGWPGQHARKTHCPKGHPYDAENTMMDGNARRCRICVRETNRKATARYRQRRRDARHP